MSEIQYKHNISKKIKEISPSPTMKMNTKTKDLISQGKHVINMSVGEPDFDTPIEICKAAIQAINNGKTRYTPAAGTKELKLAIIKKLKEENNLDYELDEIVASSGAKHSLYNVFMTICNEGDEIIIPAPYWVSYPEQVKLSGGVPVIVNCDESSGFKITPEKLEKAINQKTKAIVLNSPNNPTGAVYSKNELKDLSEVILKHNIYVISDEIYDRLVYDVEHISLPALCPELKEQTIIVNGHSKVFAMTGWRLGYIAASKEIVKPLISLQSHSTGNACTISQEAGTAAFSFFPEEMRLEFKRRRDLLLSELKNIDGIQCLKPDGAFYVFPNISKFFGKRYKDIIIDSSDSFSEALLEDQLFATIAGSSFGAPNNIRLSYAISAEDILIAVNKLKLFLSKLR